MRAKHTFYLLNYTPIGHLYVFQLPSLWQSIDLHHDFDQLIGNHVDVTNFKLVKVLESTVIKRVSASLSATNQRLVRKGLAK